ncbi:MAG: hypothetical protein C0592_11290 [Marinilabiliales bacterium]|nr:MAG: hypothetical protein C0592_11290 [Marinilabiliales bacterium]
MQKRTSLVFAMITIVISQYSCSGQKCSYCDEKMQGIVQKHIHAEFDTTVHYSLFIPSGTDEEKLPVLILFDPHGNTVPAIENYTSLAEKYGVALAGFEASENGMSFDKIKSKFIPWFDELAGLAPIDTSSVFLAGFSGGARVASMFDGLIPGIQGIAICGAGPANPQLWVKSKTDYMAFSGSRDFSLLELLSLQSQASSLKYLSVTVFPGNHEWPPVGVFADFFAFINRIANGVEENKDAEDEILARCREFLKVERPDLAINSASGGVFALQPGNAQQLSAFGDSVSSSISTSFLNEYNLVMSAEAGLQEKARAIFQNADTTRLMFFLDSLKQNHTDSMSLRFDQLLRIEAYCGIVAYSYSSQAFKAKSPQLFSQLRMYQIVEPNNNEMLFLFAAYYADLKDCVKAQEFLKLSRENGFNDKARYDKTREFDDCRDKLQY